MPFLYGQITRSFLNSLLEFYSVNSGKIPPFTVVSLSRISDSAPNSQSMWNLPPLGPRSISCTSMSTSRSLPFLTLSKLSHRISPLSQKYFLSDWRLSRSRYYCSTLWSANRALYSSCLKVSFSPARTFITFFIAAPFAFMACCLKNFFHNVLPIRLFF